jgi:hypothetical protein
MCEHAHVIWHSEEGFGLAEEVSEEETGVDDSSGTVGYFESFISEVPPESDEPDALNDFPILRSAPYVCPMMPGMIGLNSIFVPEKRLWVKTGFT